MTSDLKTRLRRNTHSTLVSMQRVSAALNDTTQMKALIEERRRLAPRTFVGFVFLHESLN